MSLDVGLSCPLCKQSAFNSNITHNLAPMAVACGVYWACWHPEEINATKAKHIFPMLESGIKLLKEHPGFYMQFDAENGWGTYENFLLWLEGYAKACQENPDMDIYTCK